MKKRSLGFLMLISVILILSTESCMVSRASYLSYSRCPTNDPLYFFRRAGAKPPKSYMRTHNFSQRRYRY